MDDMVFHPYQEGVTQTNGSVVGDSIQADNVLYLESNYSIKDQI